MINEAPRIPRKLNIWLPLLFALVMVIGMAIGMKLQPTPPAKKTASNEVPAHSLGQGKIEELIRYIEAKYVDEVDRDALVQKAINTILKELDPHSNYISAEQLKGVNEQLEGGFVGIGIEFLIVDDTLVVLSTFENGPSANAGVLAGDRILSVTDSIIAGVDMSSNDIMELLRGKKGTEVSIQVKRGQEVLDFTLTRDKIPSRSVDVSYMLDDNTGFIKVNRFSATTYEEFMQALEELKEKHQMEDLVIDLRGNPGGYLQEATNILSQLFPEKDRLMVYTEGRTVKRSDYESTGRNFHAVDDIAVLIDEGSASASEIMAGAVQDWDRGTIIGRRSFGKGLVQEQYQLRDGSALRLTVARYYTPSGRLIQKDYEDKEAYDRDFGQRFKNGELYSRDSIHVADSTIFQTAGGRVVFGGGGITPDVFIPFDSTYMMKYYVQLYSQLPTFIYRHVENNRKKYDELSFEAYESDFEISDELFYDLVAYGEDNDLPRNNEEINLVKQAIKQVMKARIAKHLYGDEGMFKVLDDSDDSIKEAVKILREDKPIVQK